MMVNLVLWIPIWLLFIIRGIRVKIVKSDKASKNFLHLLPARVCLQENFFHICNLLLEYLIFVFLTFSYQFHIVFHLCPKIWIIKWYTKCFISSYKSNSKLSRDNELSFLFCITSLLDVFDMFVYSSICPYSFLVHFGD